jgi:hypothetical protein
VALAEADDFKTRRLDGAHKHEPGSEHELGFVPGCVSVEPSLALRSVVGRGVLDTEALEDAGEAHDAT